MTVKGAFHVNLSGPFEARAALLEAFAQESIAARYISAPSSALDEQAKGWVRAEFHEGTDSPSVDFQRGCRERATTLGEQFGYTLRSYGVVVGAAAQLSHVVDKRSGALIMKGFNLTDDFLPVIAEQTGIPAEYLELREPPDVWTAPEA
ncbi:hypothetical protein ACH49_13625 [Streptomyces leeuwenhoekii]|uniref:Uncharacterized protein n=1 Tax=Streptomyces leeuwenhoekii TaxID=1437453 RepID=A0ABR5HZ12_STRLW|nr:hypothetical protein [Streptomyces leeuwenhoekii]KMS79090.1 hypothetical protein ACH49_13625 [Streptomyces leeuwenhoekii]